MLRLNVWLTTVEISDIDKQCTCKWFTQTVQHVLLFCLKHTNFWVHFFWRAEIVNLQLMLSTSVSTHQTVRWLIVNNFFSQFDLTLQISQKDISEYDSLSSLNYWKKIQWTRLDSMNHERSLTVAEVNVYAVDTLQTLWHMWVILMTCQYHADEMFVRQNQGFSVDFFFSKMLCSHRSS